MASRWSDTWIVLGCGPTASRDFAIARSLYSQAPVATCNWGVRICTEPDAYGTFEADGFWKFKDEIGRLRDYVNPRFFTTPRNARRMPDVPWTVINERFIREDAHCVLDWSMFYQGANPVGTNSGIAMLAAVASAFRPRRVVACGFNGYERDAPYDVATGVADPLASWVPIEEINDRMGRHVASLTAGVSDIEWVFVTRPAYWQDGTRATVLG